MRQHLPSLLVLSVVLLAVTLAGCLGDDAPRGDPVETTGRAADGSTGTGLDGAELSAAYRLTGFYGGEPTIGATSGGTLWVVAQDRMLKSTDGGQSWSTSWKFASEDDDLTVPPATAEDGAISNYDPMMAVDPVTDRVYFAGMFPPGACTHLAWSDDDGESWFERGPACPLGFQDHQKLVSGPVPSDAPALAGERHPSVVYLCFGTGALGVRLDPEPVGEVEAWNARTKCSVSYDGGLTWTLRNVVADEMVDGCGGNVGPPDVGPAGTVALPLESYPVVCEGDPIAVSQDTGVTWTLIEPPTGQRTRADDPMIRFGPNGTLWMAYTGLDNRTYVIGTPDLGDSWYGPVDVTPPDVNSTVFNALGVGADGRLAVAYVGTDDTDEWADDAGDEARWHLHISAVANATGDPRVSTEQVTPDEDPVQVGRICMGGALCDDGSRNLLDFIGGTVAPSGTFYVTYTEGCVDACAEAEDPDPEDSRARRTAVAWLDGFEIER